MIKLYVFSLILLLPLSLLASEGNNVLFYDSNEVKITGLEKIYVTPPSTLEKNGFIYVSEKAIFHYDTIIS